MIVRIVLSCLFAIAVAAPAAQAQPQPRTPAPPSAPPAEPPPGTPEAQAPVPRSPRAAPPAAAAPRREGQPINVKVDLTIVDQRQGTVASRKTVSVVVADGMMGFIRTSSNYQTAGRVESVPLNVDVDPTLLADNKIRLRINVQYDLPNSLAMSSDAAARPSSNLYSTQLRENLALIVENGKSIVAAQSADPVGDRQVTIEVKATVLR